MNFSTKFKVSKNTLDAYGAIDISLVCDIPLFIDPMLIFTSKKSKYKKLHKDIINYFLFLKEEATNGITDSKLKAYFKFSEIPNNWLGFSKSGNKGTGLGMDFAKYLATNLSFIDNHNISKSIHFEKIMLLSDGSGKDKISDLTANLILKFLAKYTEKFALKYIPKNLVKKFSIECGFDNKNKCPYHETFTLPFVYNKKGKPEFVLLTPKDILRVDEPSISKKNLEECYYQLNTVIDNQVLRERVNSFISVKMNEFLNQCEIANRKPTDREKEAKQKQFFIESLQENPEVYDYFIKFVEKQGPKIQELSIKEVETQIDLFFKNSQLFLKEYKKYWPKTFIPNTRKELIDRINYFKHCIEDKDCYKLLYNKNGQPIKNEDDLQRLFKFVWYGTICDVNYEANNGRGELDAAVSFGSKDKTIAEFKLASNSHGLKTICEQAEVYEKASDATRPSVYVIFYFTAQEYEKVIKLLQNSKNKQELKKNTILIDCRNDNKPSGSKL